MEPRKCSGSVLIGVYLLATFCCKGCHGDVYHRKLYRDLMVNYSRLERPVHNDSAPIAVELGLTLLQIIDVDEKNQVMIRNAWLQLFWTDVYLSRNQESYPGVQNLRFPDILTHSSLGLTSAICYVDGSSEACAPDEMSLFVNGLFNEVIPSEDVNHNSSVF